MATFFRKPPSPIPSVDIFSRDILAHDFSVLGDLVNVLKEQLADKSQKLRAAERRAEALTIRLNQVLSGGKGAV